MNDQQYSKLSRIMLIICRAIPTVTQILLGLTLFSDRVGSVMTWLNSRGLHTIPYALLCISFGAVGIILSVAWRKKQFSVVHVLGMYLVTVPLLIYVVSTVIYGLFVDRSVPLSVLVFYGSMYVTQIAVFCLASIWSLEREAGRYGGR